MTSVETKASKQEELERLRSQLKRLQADKQSDEQKLSELKSNLQRYEAATCHLGEAIWVVMDGKIVFTNPPAQKILDRSEEELASLPAAEIVAPEDAIQLNRQLSAVLETGEQPAPISVRIYTREGTVRRVEVRSVPTLWDGQLASLGFLVDITQRKREEHSVRERELFYSALVENSFDGIAITQDQTVVYINQRLAQMEGYTVEDVVGGDFWRFVHPADIANVEHFYKQRMAGQRTPDLLEASLLTRDGRRLPVEISARMISYQGKPADFLYIRDISQRKADQFAREQKEEELNALVQNLSDMVLIFDEETNIKFATPSACRMLGYPAGYFIGKKAMDFVHPDDLPRMQRNLRNVLRRNASPGPSEFRLKSSNGIWLNFEAVAENLLDHPVLHGIVMTGREITRLKQAEEEMRSLRDFNERIVYSMQEGILVQDNQGYYNFANPAAAQILGYTPEEISGKHWSDLILDEDHFIVEAATERRKQGQSDGYQVRMRCKEGDTVICWVSGNPLFEQGVFIGAVAVISDITELKRTEMHNRRLLEQQIYVNRLALTLGNLIDLDEIYESTYRMVKQLMPVDVFLVNTFNPADRSMDSGFIRAYGEKFDSRSFPKIPYADDQHKLMRTAIETGQPAYYPDFSIPLETQKRIDDLASSIGVEHQRLLKLLMSKSHSMLAIPLKVGAKAKGVLVVQSEQRDAYSQEDIDLLTALGNMAAIAVQNAILLEQARQQSEEIQQIINTVPEGVLLLDASGEILLANPAAQESLQFLTQENVGQILTHLGDCSLQELQEQPESGAWHEISTGKKIFQVAGHPIESGPVRGAWVLVVRDVTQEREVENRLQLQDRLATVGQLAAGIAHDFNNIMSTIVLYAQMAAQSPGISGQDKGRITAIYQQAMQATDLIRQILDFSRKSILERQPVPLRPLLKEQARLFERTLGEDIHISLEGMKTRGLVYADPTRIQQAMLNLAINARDAMPKGGTLKIGLDEINLKRGARKPLPEMRPGRWVRLTMADNGSGIAPEVMPHIFEPFYTTKAPGFGTGLGLPQVYGIISQHDGFIDVSSEPGSGTVFTIYLPALNENGTSLQEMNSEAISLGDEQTVLLVEDNEFVRQALTDSLELLHYRVISTSNGLEALQILLSHGKEIQLVLSDAIMPEMSGLSLIREMEDRGLQIPVVLLSGYATGKDLQNQLDQRKLEILPKPPRLSQLAAVVSRLLGNGRGKITPES